MCWTSSVPRICARSVPPCGPAGYTCSPGRSPTGTTSRPGSPTRPLHKPVPWSAPTRRRAGQQPHPGPAGRGRRRSRGAEPDAADSQVSGQARTEHGPAQTIGYRRGGAWHPGRIPGGRGGCGRSGGASGASAPRIGPGPAPARHSARHGRPCPDRGSEGHIAATGHQRAGHNHDKPGPGRRVEFPAGHSADGSGLPAGRLPAASCGHYTPRRQHGSPPPRTPPSSLTKLLRALLSRRLAALIMPGCRTK